MPNPTLLLLLEDGAVDDSFGLAAMVGGLMAQLLVLDFEKEVFAELGDMAASKASMGGNLDKGSSFFCEGNSTT